MVDIPITTYDPILFMGVINQPMSSGKTNPGWFTVVRDSSIRTSFPIHEG